VGGRSTIREVLNPGCDVSRSQNNQRAAPTQEALDVFCHYLPPPYLEAVARSCQGRLPLMLQRATAIPAMSRLEDRRALVDAFPGYRQVLSLSSPAVEALAGPTGAAELARVANDELAAVVAADSRRFPAFVATLPLSHAEASHAEIERCLRLPGAVGVQIFTSVGGLPLDHPSLLPIIEHAAQLGLAVWLHPCRAAERPDYPGEDVSEHDLWWAFGWPHESSVAMGRLVFCGLFDRHPDMVVVTHHAGGTAALMAGRLGLGMAGGPRTKVGTRTSLIMGTPLQSFRRFYADTATFGSAEAVSCARAFFGTDHLLFATDCPFGPEGGRAIIKATFDALEQLGLSEDERADVLAGNARRALRLPLSPAQGASGA
jgi:uncharacterized protein